MTVFTASGLCVGAGRWADGGLAVTLWADDPTTPETDGLRDGDAVRLHVRAGGTTYAPSDVEVTYESGHGVDGGYRRAGLYAVAAAPDEEGTPDEETPSEETPPAPAPPAPAPPAPAPPEEASGPPIVAINEVDADQGERDTAEFVEIRSAAPDAALDGLVLALVDADGTIYASVGLDGRVTSAEGLLVVRPAGAHGAGVGVASVAAPLAEIRDGVGAVALYRGAAEEFKAGTEAGTDRLVDAVVYGTGGAARADGLLAQLGQTVQYVETEDGSLQRVDVSGLGTATGAFASALLHPMRTSAGVVNARTLTVDRTAEVQDAAGLRLVSVPVLAPSGQPFVLGDLAAVNLVRGVARGRRPAQYPAAAPNVLTGFDNGGGVFVAPSTTDDAVAPGHGFFWHWFDEEAAPSSDDGGGTSRGHDLGSESFAFAATGVPVDDALSGGPYARSLTAPTDDGVYLVGNPYPYPLRLDGLTVEGATLQTTVAVWDPVRGTYEDLFAGADVLPVWGGAVAEVSGADGAFRVVTTSAAVDPTAEAPVEAAARRRTAAADARLSFDVSGTLAGGAPVADASAHLRFVDGAAPGWDRHDGTKLVPPTEAFALVAPVGERGGEPRRQRVLSLPAALDAPRTVPVAFAASGPGAFTLRWDLATLPAAWSARLVDRVTGATVDLRQAPEYAFETAEPSPWAERFELALAPAATPTAPVALAATTVSAAYPNPSTARARLDVHAGTAQRVAADVYDALGRRVARAFEGDLGAGARATVSVDTGALAPGLYVVRVEGETFRETRRVVVTR